MAVFYVLLLVPILFQHIAIRGLPFDYEKKNRWAIAFFFLFLTFLVAFRDKHVGNDTINYINYFVRCAKASRLMLSKSKLELGYTYYMKLVSLVSREPRFFLIVTAVLVSAMIYPTYRRLTSDAALTIVLFCMMSTFVMMFSGLRQMMAVGIGMIAYEFTRQKKPILFVLSVVAAMLFHSSAFMLLLMYPLYHVKITKKWLAVLVPVLLMIFVFNGPIFSVLNLIAERYTRFEGNVSSSSAYAMIILFAAFTAFAFVIPDDSQLDEETVGLRNFLIFSLVLQMFAPLHVLAMRLNYYYIIFIPLLLPKVISSADERWRQVADAGRHVMVVFFLMYFFFNAYRGGSLHVFPYHFCWESGI